MNPGTFWDGVREWWRWQIGARICRIVGHKHTRPEGWQADWDDYCPRCNDWAVPTEGTK